MYGKLGSKYYFVGDDSMDRSLYRHISPIPDDIILSRIYFTRSNVPNLRISKEDLFEVLSVEKPVDLECLLTTNKKLPKLVSVGSRVYQILRGADLDKLYDSGTNAIEIPKVNAKSDVDVAKYPDIFRVTSEEPVYSYKIVQGAGGDISYVVRRGPATDGYKDARDLIIALEGYPMSIDMIGYYQVFGEHESAQKFLRSESSPEELLGIDRTICYNSNGELMVIVSLLDVIKEHEAELDFPVELSSMLEYLGYSEDYAKEVIWYED